MILARVGDKEQNKTANMAEIEFFRGVNEYNALYFNKTMLNLMESTIIILGKFNFCQQYTLGKKLAYSRTSRDRGCPGKLVLQNSIWRTEA